MTTTPIRLSPGSVVGFEGLDKAGKSTQLDLLRANTAVEGTLFTHMPSGLTPFTHNLYAILESQPPASGLGRQLAHLASHSENVAALRAAARSGALVLERWWWSTMAYGGYGGDVADTGLSEAALPRIDRLHLGAGHRVRHLPLPRPARGRPQQRQRRCGTATASMQTDMGTESSWCRT
jgi:hypothetical protein